MTLVNQIKLLQAKPIVKIIDRRLQEFKSYSKRSNSYWFSELCFCILTANSRAKTAIAIQKEVGIHGFENLKLSQLVEVIKKNKHRFHNNKAKFIVDARKHLKIKDIIQSHKSSFNARNWLQQNIKGIGFKEASHFLRNVGYFDLAILDRHILKLLFENGDLKMIPKSLPFNEYYRIEKILAKKTKYFKISQAKLDMLMWYMKTKEVLK